MVVSSPNQKGERWHVQQCTACGRYLGCKQDIEACQDQEHSRLPHFEAQTGIWHALIVPLPSSDSQNGQQLAGHRQRNSASKNQPRNSPQSPRKGDNPYDGSTGVVVYLSEETLTALCLTQSTLLSLDDKVVARIAIGADLEPFVIHLAPKFFTESEDSLFGTVGTEHQHLVKIRRVKLDMLSDVGNVHLVPSVPIDFSQVSVSRQQSDGGSNSTDARKRENLEVVTEMAKNYLSANFFHQNQPFQLQSYKFNVRVPMVSEYDHKHGHDNIFTRGYFSGNTISHCLSVPVLDDKFSQLSVSNKSVGTSNPPSPSDKLALAYSECRIYRLAHRRDARVVVRDCTLLDQDLSGETFQALCGPSLFDKLINFFRAQILSSGDLIRMGFRPPRGLLIHGSPGTGKSSLCAYLADLADTHTVVITADRVFSRFYGECEAALRSLFDNAIASAPSTIIIDDIDVFCTKGEAERKLVACLCSLLDMVHRLPGSVRLFVIAATSKLESVDVSLRRYGRLDHEFELLAPDNTGRRAIMEQLLSRADHLLSPEDFDQIADMTSSFVAADIRALCTEAALLCSMKNRKNESQSQMPLTPLTGEDGRQLPVPSSVDQICYDDFTAVLPSVRPTARRDICIEVPHVSWADIGGLDDVKKRLRQCVEWPLMHGSALTRLGLKPPKGALLYGPPGCSKTMIARAMATESGLAFLSIKGPELFNKWLGESERAVRQLFRRARQASPSIIFFDEVDAVAPARSGGPSTGSSSSQAASSASERVVAQLLTELDGIQDLDQVFVLAATNRPDVLDTAIIRPGRLDRLIYVPLPDGPTRRQILTLQFARTPIKSGHGEAFDAFMDRLVERTDGYTGAELVSLVQETAFHALERSHFNATDVREHDFDYAFKVVKARTDSRLLEAYDLFSYTH